MPDLSALEEQFFQTGELPPELATQAEPEPEPILEPKVDPDSSTPTLEQQQADPLEALRRTLQEEQTRRIQAETRLQDIEKQSSAPKPVAAPDPQTDPLGSMFHQLQQVNTAVADLQAKLNQEQSGRLQQQQLQQFVQSVQQIKNDYAKTVPDFDAAYAHVRAVRTEDMRSHGVTEDQIPNMLTQAEFNMAQTAITQGKNPAEEIYKMSKRYGYQAKAAPAQKQTAEQKLEQLSKGADAARSPAKGAPDTELTAESLSDADDASLSKFVQDDKLWNKLVGGGTPDIFKH